MTDFVVAGTGFWASYQVRAWAEVSDAPRCVAVCDPDVRRAQAFAKAHGIHAVYDTLEAALDAHDARFVDVISSVDAHAALAAAAASRGVDVICQKPLAGNHLEAQSMVDHAERCGTRLLVHENWRFQRPLRALAETLATSKVGRVFRGQIDYTCRFDVGSNQPALRCAAQFILLDIGPHVFDVVRYLFGQPQTVYCRTTRVDRRLSGEDVATVVFGWSDGRTVTCVLSYATTYAEDPFPQTRVVLEAEGGTLSLERGCVVAVENAGRRTRTSHLPRHYDWSVDPYTLVQDSIVACNAHLWHALRSGQRAETEAADNLRSLALVFAAYESAASGVPVAVDEPLRAA